MRNFGVSQSGATSRIQAGSGAISAPPEGNMPGMTCQLTKLESALDDIIGLFQAEKNTLAREGEFSKGKEGYVPHYNTTGC